MRLPISPMMVAIAAVLGARDAWGGLKYMARMADSVSRKLPRAP